jgi:hypothetical protein
MCLWSVQYCPDCFIFTPVPTVAPQRCSNSQCLRTTLDPHHLSKEEMKQYLEDDFPCLASCHKEQCGLMIRYRYCGEIGAVRSECDPCLASHYLL